MLPVLDHPIDLALEMPIQRGIRRKLRGDGGVGRGGRISDVE